MTPIAKLSILKLISSSLNTSGAM